MLIFGIKSTMLTDTPIATAPPYPPKPVCPDVNQINDNNNNTRPDYFYTVLANEALKFKIQKLKHMSQGVSKRSKHEKVSNWKSDITSARHFHTRHDQTHVVALEGANAKWNAR